MDLQLKGKVGLVTGAGQGIGKAIALGLGEEGVNLALCDLDERSLEEAAREIEQKTKSQVLPVVADMTKLGDIKEFIARAEAKFGRIDIHVNSAGASRFGALLELPDEAWFEAMQLKYFGYVRCIREVTPPLIRAGGGSIINIIGIGGIQVQPTHAPGGCSNAALRLLNKSAALELAKYNIRVNAVHPGAIGTERIKKLIKTRAQVKGVTEEEERKAFVADVALKRLGEPRSVADAVLFFASPRSFHITGAELLVDGGLTKGI